MSPRQLWAILIWCTVGMAVANLDADRAECADELAGLATCLPYVGGDAKEATVECCTGLKEVVNSSQKCLCVLLKDRDDPNLGIRLNTTLALNLPNACHVPTNFTKCLDLLHLAPNSSEAKIFEGFNGNGKAVSTPTTTGNSSTSHGIALNGDTSNGARFARRKGIIRIIFGSLILYFAPNLVLYV